MELFLSLPEHYVKDQVCTFLCLKSLVSLDTAVANRSYRSHFLQVISSCAVHVQSLVAHTYDQCAMRWLSRNNVRVQHVTILLDGPVATCFLTLRALPISTHKLTLRYCANGAIKNDHKCFGGYANIQCLRLHNCYPDHVTTLTHLMSMEIFRANQLTDEQVGCICAHCRKIKHIALRECGQLTPVCVPLIARTNPELLSLNFSGGRGAMDDSRLQILGEHCALLQNVCLNSRFSSYTDQGVIALAMRCTDLRKLSLHSNFSITDAAVHAIGVHCPRITHLQLRTLDCLTNASFDTITAVFLHLEVLHIDRSQRNSTGAIVSLVQQCRTLHTLVLTGRSHITDQLFRVLAPELSHLRALGMPSAEYITDYSIELVALHCPQLRKLNISGCDGLTVHSILTLARHCKSVQVLHAYGCEAVTDKALVMLARNGSLIELDVRECGSISTKGVAVLQTLCVFRYLCVDMHLVCAVPKQLRPPLDDYDLDQFE